MLQFKSGPIPAQNSRNHQEHLPFGSQAEKDTADSQEITVAQLPADKTIYTFASKEEALTNVYGNWKIHYLRKTYVMYKC